jgi:2-dehydro-3-deoxyphosphogluconate aldolase/(4S)-4-hydroxy-2-oxoglutarate aldolase
MPTNAWLTRLQQQRAIAVIRAADPEQGLAMARAVAAGGMQLIEITWNSTEPAALVRHLRRVLPHCSIGAGTVLSEAEAEAAIAAGANFCVSPHTDPRIIQVCQSRRVPVVPGALTPNEIVTAWAAGASVVKVFPISTAGGAAYVRNLQGPLGHIPLLPTGGISLDHSVALVQAGAIGVGLSSSLFPQAAVAQGDWTGITQLASGLMQALAQVPLELHPYH